MTARGLVSLIAVAITANPVIAQIETGDRVPADKPKIIHEAFASFVPFDAAAQPHRIAPISAQISDAFQDGVNVFDLGELTMDEVIRNVGEEVALSPDPDRVGWVRSTGVRPIRAGDMHLLPFALQDGSTVRTVSLRSTGAQGLRIHFQDFDVPAGEVILFAAEPGGMATVGPYSGKGPIGNGDFWSAILPGDTVFIELRSTGEVHFEITELAHLDRGLDPPAADANVSGGPLGCHLDAMCSSDISDAARLATGRMSYVVGDVPKSCTGTLLGDLDDETVVPYFLTAYHCISSQSVADTLQVTWFWERASCGGALPTFSLLPSTMGATLLEKDDTADGNDMSFFRLNGPLPNGIALAGWSTGHPESAYGIHHPAGSWKRVTYLSDVGSCGGCTFCGDPFDYDYYDFDNGITEPGSSGSGIFNFSGQLFGQLFGHCCLYLSCGGEDISCSNVDEHVAQYGEFETTYPIIDLWLKIGGTINVDGNCNCVLNNGTPSRPFETVGAANDFAWNGARIKIQSGSYPETLTMDKQLTILASGGTVTIGE